MRIMAVNVELVTVGQPDMSGRLLVAYGTGAIRRYLTDDTLTEPERGNLEQLGKSLGKLNQNKGLIYVANEVVPYEWSTKYVDLRHVDPLASAYIKLWDPEATGPYDSLLFRVRNPDTTYEHDISKVFKPYGRRMLKPEERDEKLRGIFSDFDGGSGKIKPSVEIALVERDQKTLDRPGARIRWEWNTKQYKVVTRGHVPGRNDVIPNSVPGIPGREVPIVSFTRMRNAVILQAAS